MKTLSLLTVVVMFTFLSCVKHKDCPAFNDNDLSFVPYQIGDTITFTSTNQEKYSIYIQAYDKSTSYSFECKDLKGICPCTDYVSVIACDSENTTNYTFLQLEQSDASDRQYYKYQLKDFYFEFDFRNELPYIDDFPNIKLISSTSIANTTYNNVVELTNIYDDNASVLKVYFTQTHGIVKFIEKHTATEWVITK